MLKINEKESIFNMFRRPLNTQWVKFAPRSDGMYPVTQWVKFAPRSDGVYPVTQWVKFAPRSDGVYPVTQWVKFAPWSDGVYPVTQWLHISHVGQIIPPAIKVNFHVTYGNNYET
ncbi:hypothetical protein OTU49_001071 [Cherax quadricarinatus]|uniref:Uncharacterized protein n=1 Tax=Cherax quadricarinatus TaxID=27406 RepID=A0AAW0XX42_CHEQU